MGVLSPLRENTGRLSSAATGMSSVIDQFQRGADARKPSRENRAPAGWDSPRSIRS